MKCRLPSVGQYATSNSPARTPTSASSAVLYDAKDIRDIVRRLPLRPVDNPTRFAQATLQTAMELFIGKSCPIRYTTLSDEQVERETDALKGDVYSALKTRDCLIGRHQYNKQFFDAILYARDLLLSSLTGNCYSCKNAIGSPNDRAPSAFCAKLDKPLPPGVGVPTHQYGISTQYSSNIPELANTDECFEPPEKPEILHRIKVSAILAEKHNPSINSTGP